MLAAVGLTLFLHCTRFSTPHRKLPLLVLMPRLCQSALRPTILAICARTLRSKTWPRWMIDSVLTTSRHGDTASPPTSPHGIVMGNKRYVCTVSQPLVHGALGSAAHGCRAATLLRHFDVKAGSSRGVPHRPWRHFSLLYPRSSKEWRFLHLPGKCPLLCALSRTMRASTSRLFCAVACGTDYNVVVMAHSDSTSFNLYATPASNCDDDGQCSQLPSHNCFLLRCFDAAPHCCSQAMKFATGSCSAEASASHLSEMWVPAYINQWSVQIIQPTSPIATTSRWL